VEALATRRDTQEFSVKPIISRWKFSDEDLSIRGCHARKQFAVVPFTSKSAYFDGDSWERLASVLDTDDKCATQLNAVAYATSHGARD
jgi:hypothetical protein